MTESKVGINFSRVERAPLVAARLASAEGLCRNLTAEGQAKPVWYNPARVALVFPSMPRPIGVTDPRRGTPHEAEPR